MLAHGVTEELAPFVGLEVGQLVRRGCNGGEPIIEDDMEAGGDGAGVRIESNGNTACVFAGESHVDNSLGAGVPAGNLLAISEMLIELVDWASPRVQVVELALFPARTAKYINRCEPSGGIRHVIV